MQMAKIKARVMRRRHVSLLTDMDGNLWISAGDGAYLADSSIGITGKNVLAVLDVEKDKQNDIQVDEAEFEDERLCNCAMEQDEQLWPMESVMCGGDLVTPMTTEGGEVIFVSQEVLKPANIKGVLEFWLRRGDGTRSQMIACREGLLCHAVVCPVADSTAEVIRQRMKTIAEMRLIRSFREGNREEEPEQMRMIEE